MFGGYKIITICGSTKFKDEFNKVAKDLTLQGYIVLTCNLFGHSGDIEAWKKKEMLDNMHRRKIDMSDEVFIINKNNYIGKSTKIEIEYAKFVNKPIRYYTDEYFEIHNTKTTLDNCIDKGDNK